MRILTFNTWLLETPVFGMDLARDLQSRLQRLSQAVIDTDADVIFLQEVWKKKFQRPLILEFKKFGYHYCHQDTSRLGRMGNGLMIFSKFPFASNPSTFSYQNYTRVDEFFAKKGVLTSTIAHPKLGNILLANTHLGAVNFNPIKGINSVHQMRQVEQKKELITFLKNKMKDTEHFIMGADLNIHDHPWDTENKVRDLNKHSHGYQLILNELNLLDTYREKFSDRDHSEYHGATYTSQNPYTASVTNMGFSIDERVDYIFTNNDGLLNVKDCSIVFQSRLDSGHHLSDHYGLLSTLEY